MSDHDTQTIAFRTAVVAHSAAHGAGISKQVEANSQLLILWVSYLSKYKLTGTGDRIMSVLISAVRETAAYLSLGLVRPALSSLRAEMDMALAWLYFKDHAVEWDYVNTTGDGFKLKKELLQELERYVPRYTARIGILRQIATRSQLDPYRMLSAHIHGQSDHVLTSLSSLQSMVRPMSECDECIKISFEVSEYINDIFLAIYADSWHALPAEIIKAVDSRFKSSAQRVEFTGP